MAPGESPAKETHAVAAPPGPSTAAPPSSRSLSGERCIDFEEDRDAMEAGKKDTCHHKKVISLVDQIGAESSARALHAPKCRQVITDLQQLVPGAREQAPQPCKCVRLTAEIDLAERWRRHDANVVARTLQRSNQRLDVDGLPVLRTNSMVIQYS